MIQVTFGLSVLVLVSEKTTSPWESAFNRGGLERKKWLERPSHDNAIKPSPPSNTSRRLSFLFEYNTSTENPLRKSSKYVPHC